MFGPRVEPMWSLQRFSGGFFSPVVTISLGFKPAQRRFKLGVRRFVQLPLPGAKMRLGVEDDGLRSQKPRS